MTCGNPDNSWGVTNENACLPSGFQHISGGIGTKHMGGWELPKGYKPQIPWWLGHTYQQPALSF